MMSIVFGLFLIAMGIWGVVDEYYFVVDFLKGGLPVAMMLGGLLATLAGIVPYTREDEEDD